MNSLIKLEVLKKAMQEVIDNKLVDEPFYSIFKSFLDNGYKTIKEDLLLSDTLMKNYLRDIGG